MHKDIRTEFGSHGHKCIFIGYSEESKAYRVYDLVKKQVLINRDVVFKELEPPTTEEIQEIPAPPLPKTSSQEVRKTPSKSIAELDEPVENPV